VLGGVVEPCIPRKEHGGHVAIPSPLSAVTAAYGEKKGPINVLDAAKLLIELDFQWQSSPPYPSPTSTFATQ
jgi:hypothetical protein